METRTSRGSPFSSTMRKRPSCAVWCSSVRSQESTLMREIISEWMVLSSINFSCKTPSMRKRTTTPFSPGSMWMSEARSVCASKTSAFTKSMIERSAGPRLSISSTLLIWTGLLEIRISPRVVMSAPFFIGSHYTKHSGFCRDRPIQYTKHPMNRWFFVTFLGIIIVVGTVALFVLPPNTANAPGGLTWVTERGNADILRNISIHPGDAVTSPLGITGEARGTWFFEASFPVTLTDWDGKIIAQLPAQAIGDWMTEEYVPFGVTLTFDTPTPGDPTVNRGFLILQKDNPSGLPEHDDALEIPVIFK